MTHKDNGEGFVVGADADIVCQCRFCCSTIGFCANAWPLSRNSLRSCFSLYDGTETVRFHFSYVVFPPYAKGTAGGVKSFYVKNEHKENVLSFDIVELSTDRFAESSMLGWMCRDSGENVTGA